MVSACLARASQVDMFWNPSIKQCHLTEPRKPSFSVMASGINPYRNYCDPHPQGTPQGPESLDILPGFGGSVDVAPLIDMFFILLDGLSICLIML